MKPIVDCTKSITRQDGKVKRYPLKGGEELAVSGSIRAQGSVSSPTPFRGYPFLETGAGRLRFQKPWVGLGLGLPGGWRW